MGEDNEKVAKQLGIATNSSTVFLISVENDNFAVEEYPCTEFGVNDLDSSYSFILKDHIFFVAEKNVFGYNPLKHKWIKIAKRLNVVRYGSASVSLKEGAIIAGGKESDGKGIPEITDSCVLLRKEKNKLVSIKLNKLPKKARYLTLTCISEDSFVMCGGMNSKGHETNDAYFGTLVRSKTDWLNLTFPIERGSRDNNEQGWCVHWRKLPKMCEWRSNHFAMYTNNRLYVFGGGPRRTEKQHLKELNLKYCGFDTGLFAGTKAEVLSIKIEDDKVYCSNKFQTVHDMAYDISFATAVLSPDQKYCVVAGGEIYGDAELKKEDTYLTMSTKNLVLRALGDKEPIYEDDTFFTNNLLKNIFTCDCFTPMPDE